MAEEIEKNKYENKNIENLFNNKIAILNEELSSIMIENDNKMLKNKDLIKLNN